MTDNQARWSVIGALGGLDAMWAWSLGIDVTVAPALVAPAVLAAVALFYTYLRPVERIASLASIFAQLQSLGVAIAFLSYLVVTARFPLIDAHLAAVDVWLGFDWPGWFWWVGERPWVEQVLKIAYESGMVQPAVLLLIFSVLGRMDRASELVWIAIPNALLAIAVSMVLPAIGAWSWYGVADRVDAYHLQHFLALRDGSLESLDVATMKGLITFPSFHAALCVIFVYVTRGIKVLFPVALALNALMLISTPIIGGHHFIDIPAGVLVAGMVIVGYRWVTRGQPRPVAATGAPQSAGCANQKLALCETNCAPTPPPDADRRRL